MIKYNKQLEHKNEYYLPLIDTFEMGKVECKYQIPLSFYIENKDLFEESKNYINLFKKIDIEKYWRENSFQSYECYMAAGDNLSEYDRIHEELYWVVEGYNKLDFNANDVKNLISIVIQILRLLMDVYPHNKEIYEKSLNKFESAYEKLQKLSTIIYDKNAIKYKKIFLPDSWFILPNQTLYNTGNGHKGTNLVNDFYLMVSPAFERSKNLQGTSKYYFDLAKDIKENGFTEGHFKSFLNYSYFPVYTDTTRKIPTCHEKYTLDHIVSVVMAKAYFYNFIEKIQNYCLNPKEEFDKLNKMTADELTDIFVRCCGFHKVESQLEKTITTSDVNYKESFKEYIDNGWNIEFRIPIIVQRDLGIISELDMESLFVEKYIKQRQRK